MRVSDFIDPKFERVDAGVVKRVAEVGGVVERDMGRVGE